MTDSVLLLKEDLEKGIHSNSKLNDSSQKVTQAIGNAIIALQTQDIISQKLQHIYDISEEMQMRYENTKSNKQEKCSDLRFIEKASLVVSSQIQSIKEELNTAETSIRSSLDFITTAISNIEQSSRSGNSGIKSDSNDHLLTAFHDAEVTIRETERIAKDAFDEIEPIRGMASNVTEIILGLSAQLHLIGLNAEVHAARAGGGSGLETLSSKTSHISRQTRALCSSVSTELDALVSNLNTSVTNFESLYKEAAINRTHLEEIKPKQDLKISDYSSLHERSVQNIRYLSEKLVGPTETTRNSLNFKHLMRTELDEIENELSHLSKTTKMQADRMNIEVDIAATMESLLSRYTMQSEKSVHLTALGLPACNVDASARESIESNFGIPDKGSIESMEFDMNNRLTELTDVPAGNPEDDDSGFGDNVDLF
tara:strand:- start:438 stop:1715 length:1278 start_codon:yes stop_codon:yes gene_type:complete